MPDDAPCCPSGHQDIRTSGHQDIIHSLSKYAAFGMGSHRRTMPDHMHIESWLCQCAVRVASISRQSGGPTASARIGLRVCPTTKQTGATPWSGHQAFDRRVPAPASLHRGVRPTRGLHVELHDLSPWVRDGQSANSGPRCTARPSSAYPIRTRNATARRSSVAACSSAWRAPVTVTFPTRIAACLGNCEVAPSCYDQAPRVQRV